MVTIENVRQKIKENDYPAMFKKAGMHSYAETAEELVVFVKSMEDQGIFEEFSTADDTKPILQEHIDGLNKALEMLEKGEIPAEEPAGCCCHEKEEAKVQITEITPETKLADLLAAHPELKQQMQEINPRFKMLTTPLARVMIPKATVAMMSSRSGMPVDELIEAIKVKIGLK